MMNGLIYRNLEPYLTCRVASAARSLDIICPYVRANVLQRLLAPLAPTVSTRLVMRWSAHDFLEGQSDPAVFDVCRSRGVLLKHHRSVHMKLWGFDREMVVATSANISERGLGNSPGDNREFLLTAMEASIRDLALIDAIFSESELVTEKMYLAAIQEVGDRHETEIPQGTSPTVPITLCQLPTTNTPREVWADYYRGAQNDDVVRYDIPPQLNERYFMAAISDGFMKSPLVVGLTQRLRSGNLYFGELKQWIRASCVDLPSPSARDLTVPAGVFLNWLEGLGRGKFTIDRPNVSERLSYDTNVDPETLLSLPGERTTARTQGNIP